MVYNILEDFGVVEIDKNNDDIVELILIHLEYNLKGFGFELRELMLDNKIFDSELYNKIITLYNDLV